MPGPLRPSAERGLVSGSVDARGVAVGGRVIEFETVGDSSTLRMCWYLPPLAHEYGKKSLTYLTAMLGDEGPGSLVEQLRTERGWIDALSAGASHTASTFCEVEISLALTAEGMAHLDEVVALVFAAIALVRERPAEKWRWDEDAQIAQLEWRFAEAIDGLSLAVALSASLLEIDQIPLCDALRAPFAYREFDGAQIAHLSSQLVPETLLLYVGGQGLAKDAADGGVVDVVGYATDSGWVHEEFYGARLRVRPLSDAQLALWTNTALVLGASTLSLPLPNQYLPADLRLLFSPPAKHTPSDGVAPTLLLDSPTGRLWHYPDSQFGQPRAAIRCTVTAAGVLEDARALWSTQLLISMATDALKARAYPAAVAGLSASVSVGIEGIDLSVSGYSDKLMRLLDLAVASIAPGADFPASRFEPVKTAVVRDLHADKFAGSMTTALTQLKVLVRSRPGFYERLAAVPIVEALTLEDMRAAAVNLKSGGSYTECLVAGNVREADARQALAAVRATLGDTPLADGALEQLRQRVHSLPVGDHLWEQEALNPDEVNSAVALYFEVGSTAGSLRDEACLELLVMLMQQAAFDQLRTAEQLGYTIGAQAYRAWSAQAILLYARSDSASAGYLDERFEAFLQAHAAVLRATSESTLETMRAALVAIFATRDRSLADRSTRMWSEIEMHNCVFDRARTLQQLAHELTLADVVALYDRTFLSAQTRRKLAIWITAPGEVERPAPYRVKGTLPRQGFSVIVPDSSGVEAFRASCTLLPAPALCAAFATTAAEQLSARVTADSIR